MYHVTHITFFLNLLCRGAIGFGGMAVVAGILGTVMGSELSKFLGRHTRKAEAIVCCMSMMVGTPFLFMALVVVQYKVIYVSWACVFFATLSTCLVWTPVSAMLLVCVVLHKWALIKSYVYHFCCLLNDVF